MGLALAAIGVLMFNNGCRDEELVKCAQEIVEAGDGMRRPPRPNTLEQYGKQTKRDDNQSSQHPNPPF